MDVDKMFTQCPPIVENIFKHLSARDLSSCAQVCKMWNSFSKTEYKRRIFMEWFLQHGDKEHFREMFGCLPSGKYSFQEHMLGARIRPATCFCLLTNHLVNTMQEEVPPPFKKLKLKRCEKTRHCLKAISDRYLKPCLPAECQLFSMSSPGIIGTSGNQTTVEVEVGAAIAGILIPHLPGVEVHHMALEENAEFPRTPIKCLLMFVGSNLAHIQPFVNRCVANQSEKFALGGAIISAPTTGVGSCFALAGENVEAASILVDYNMTSHLAAELRGFEQTGLLQHQCFCFAFTCIGKGIQMYKTSNYESDLFRKIYPKVPLLGVFGYGEIGAYHLPNGQGKAHRQKIERFGHGKCVRDNSTTFVLVAVKNAK